MLKKYLIFGLLTSGVLLLSACGAPTNTNSITIDLTSNSNASVVNSNLVVINSNINAAVSNSNQSANLNSASNSVAIEILPFGFSPKSKTVKADTVVTWQNSSGTTVQIASDPHPTHTDLQDLNSGSLADGQAYSYTFKKLGTWGYHNHLNPTEKGEVVVE